MNVIEWVADFRVPQGRVRAGFTSRHGGVSTAGYDSLNLGFHVGDAPTHVQANRAIVGAQLGCEPAWMNQVHGSHVELAQPGVTAEATDALVVARGPSGGTGPLHNAGDDAVLAGGPLPWLSGEADAFCAHPATQRAYAACVMVADCIPLILVDQTALRGAAVHVGRAGLLADIATQAIRSLGGPASHLCAFIGPAICGKCYEVPEAMRVDAAHRVPECASETSWGTPSIDLKAGLKAQLSRAGIQHVADVDICTLEDDRYFSHRGGGSQSGRFAGVLQVICDTPSEPQVP